MGMAPELHPYVWKGSGNKMTIFDTPIYVSSMKYALKSVPGLADFGVPHGDGNGYRTSARCLEGVRKKFQMTNFTMHNNI